MLASMFASGTKHLHGSAVGTSPRVKAEQRCQIFAQPSFPFDTAHSIASAVFTDHEHVLPSENQKNILHPTLKLIGMKLSVDEAFVLLLAVKITVPPGNVYPENWSV
jgi:hypothetical protein